MDDWAFIDTEGNTMSKKTDIYNVGLSFGGVKVSSDYFSYEALFEEAGITKDGFGKYKYGMKAAEIAGCGASSTDEPCSQTTWLLTTVTATAASLKAHPKC